MILGHHRINACLMPGLVPLLHHLMVLSVLIFIEKTYNYLTKLLAKELGPEICVNTVAPGLIITPHTIDFTIAIEKFEMRTPLKRTDELNDIAELVIALIKSNYINGVIVTADGEGGVRMKSKLRAAILMGSFSLAVPACLNWL